MRETGRGVHLHIGKGGSEGRRGGGREEGMHDNVRGGGRYVVMCEGMGGV